MTTAQPDLDAAVRELAAAESVAFGGVGIAGTLLPATEAYHAVEAALPDRAEELRPRLVRLLTDASPAGRVYAATLLGRVDPAAARAAWQSMLGDHSDLSTFTGCFLDRTTLAEYAARRLSPRDGEAWDEGVRRAEGDSLG